MNTHSILTEKQANIASQYREDYYYLISHIDAFTTFLREECELDATVWVLPTSTEDDIGAEILNLAPETITGHQAVIRALDHLYDHRITQDQSGMFAKRLPGVLQINTDNEKELLSRINTINMLKKALEDFLVKKLSNTDERFLVASTAVPLSIRKSITRQIHVLEHGKTKSIGFSFSANTSMSKTHERDYWIQKAINAKENAKKSAEAEKWIAHYEMTERILNNLTPETMLRVERKLRRSPIININNNDGTKGTVVAHSPILVVNESVKVNALRSYKGKAKKDESRQPVLKNPYSAPEDEKKVTGKRMPIIENWHLYEVIK